jgi:hypothetical protein
MRRRAVVASLVAERLYGGPTDAGRRVGEVARTIATTVNAATDIACVSGSRGLASKSCVEIHRDGVAAEASPGIPTPAVIERQGLCGGDAEQRGGEGRARYESPTTTCISSNEEHKAR